MEGTRDRRLQSRLLECARWSSALRLPVGYRISQTATAICSAGWSIAGSSDASSCILLACAQRFFMRFAVRAAESNCESLPSTTADAISFPFLRRCASTEERKSDGQFRLCFGWPQIRIVGSMLYAMRSARSSAAMEFGSLTVRFVFSLAASSLFASAMAHRFLQTARRSLWSVNFGGSSRSVIGGSQHALASALFSQAAAGTPFTARAVMSISFTSASIMTQTSAHKSSAHSRQTAAHQLTGDGLCAVRRYVQSFYRGGEYASRARHDDKVRWGMSHERRVTAFARTLTVAFGPCMLPLLSSQLSAIERQSRCHWRARCMRQFAE